ncbi:MAG: HD family phosphohydrolase [Phycisphaerales bacterium]
MSREPSTTPLKTRRGEIRRAIPRPRAPIWSSLRAPAIGWGLIIWGAFALVIGAVVAWTCEQPLVAVGRVMRDTRTVYSNFQVIDQVATEREREKARVQSPRVYVADAATLDGIRASIESLPKALAGAETLDEVEPSIREQFALTPQALAAIKNEAVGGGVSGNWRTATRLLAESLVRTPILEQSVFQIENTSVNPEVELRTPEGKVVRASKRSVLSIGSANLADDIGVLVFRAGFRSPLLESITARIRHQLKPTYTFDAAATSVLSETSAAAVPMQRVVYPDKHVIFRRGDVLKAEQRALFVRELSERRKNLEPWQTWTARLGRAGLVAAVALALAGYAILFSPRLRRNPLRVAAVACLLGATAAAACIATALEPAFVSISAVAPTILVSIILAVAYDRRLALAYGALHAVIVCAALNLSIAWYLLLIAGVGASIWRLREVRDRDTFIRMGAMCALVLAVGMMVVGATEYPVALESLRQSGVDAGLAGFAGLLVSGVALFILPSIERVFAVTTGMTLIELRDPKQPLLRLLQQKAPGTYNHSLNVANLAEAAADSIGADSLLTYVGALYHDIGKMNKPEYFVENQTPGINKHDKLSPAMSLLIIVGHVKDGLELAAEFNLPHTLRHFIEAHHGTTLVEYFYQRARRLAGADGEAAPAGANGGARAPAPHASSALLHDAPDEFEYRYPGPRPRTKECAILMLCDAIESASRTLADPTPSRIEALVRSIASKRLHDGQFDECDLTLRELSSISEAIARTLTAVYHGRIAYPTPASPAPSPMPPPASAGPKTTMFTLPSETRSSGSRAM